MVRPALRSWRAHADVTRPRSLKNAGWELSGRRVGGVGAEGVAHVSGAPPPLQSEVRKETGAGWNTGQEPTPGILNLSTRPRKTKHRGRPCSAHPALASKACDWQFLPEPQIPKAAAGEPGASRGTHSRTCVKAFAWNPDMQNGQGSP